MIAGLVSRGWGRYFRFKVRGLIVLVFVVGAGMGWAVHVRRVQRRAVVAIQKAGGNVVYDWQWKNGSPGRSWAPKWLVDGIGVDYFGHVTQVAFPNGGSDAELVHVGNLSRLEQLILSGSAVTDAGLVDLKNLTRLQTLHLQGTKVTDVGLAHLSGLSSLRQLYLNNTQVIGTGFVHFKSLTDLQVLNLNITPVNDTGLKYLKDVTSLRELCLLGTQVTDAGLGHLVGLHNLNVLDVPHTAVTDGGLEHLTKLPNLQDMRLDNTAVSDAGLEKLKRLTRLQRVTLAATEVSDAGDAGSKRLCQNCGSRANRRSAARSVALRTGSPLADSPTNNGRQSNAVNDRVFSVASWISPQARSVPRPTLRASRSGP